MGSIDESCHGDNLLRFRFAPNANFADVFFHNKENQ
jgi:hypothetical protein